MQFRELINDLTGVAETLKYEKGWGSQLGCVIRAKAGDRLV
ncbi:hypothetical protein [Chroococcidiopsis sp. CCMEE 29]|nr:hypothetical protein [Chroococcidiopsis sp. CCMEE 29]